MVARVTDFVITIDGSENVVARIYGLGFLESEPGISVNNLTLLEGRLPESSDECVVEQSGNNFSDIDIGATISFSKENEDYENLSDIYAVQQYTVTGIVSNPFYISVEKESANTGTGFIGAILYVDESCYSLDVYTDLYIRVADAKSLSTYSDSYEVLINEYSDRLESLGKQRSLLRYNNLLSKATQQLQESEIEYAENKATAETELADALEELNSAAKKIADGKAQLIDAKNKLAQGEQSLADQRAAYQQQINSSQAQLDAGFSNVSSASAQLDAIWQELESIAPEIEAAEEAQEGGATLDSETLAEIQQYYNTLNYHNENRAILAAQLESLNAAQAQLDAQKEAAEISFAEAEAELSGARKKIVSSEASIKNAEEELANGTAEYDTARAEADTEFEDAEKKNHRSKTGYT